MKLPDIEGCVAGVLYSPYIDVPGAVVGRGKMPRLWRRLFVKLQVLFENTEDSTSVKSLWTYDMVKLKQMIFRPL